MNDALLMGGFQRFGDLAGNGQRLIERDCVLHDAMSQCGPIDQLQDERPRVAALPQAVDAGDVGMIQRGKDFGLTLKAGRRLGLDSS